jgi:predicted DCC family thiol-disulfide oxidoreductase YuxK
MSERRTTVFYDGECPVCSREIAFYKGRRRASAIDWVDVATLPPDVEVAPGLSACAALARFHVVTRDGRTHDGGPAFIALWRELGGLFAGVGWFLSIPPGPIILGKAYDWFLANRSRLIARKAE